jgi:hypothetical protein
MQLNNYPFENKKGFQLESLFYNLTTKKVRIDEKKVHS